MTRRHDRVKRVLDIAVAVPLFVLSLPIQGLTALLIRARLGRPVFFRQLRPGRDGEPFVMVKFRTMLDAGPGVGVGDDASRMTPFGSRLRASSLDELPTLWNIIRGDMSLVGPRPLLMAYLERYSPEQARRHEVRPGLTGLAQITGRNALGWEDKLRLDVEYVDHHSLRGDLKILLATVRSVLRRDGISAAGQATMAEFMGSPDQGDTDRRDADRDIG